MKKYGSMILFILITFFIQINFFQSVNFIKISPNLLIVIVVGYGLSLGYIDGLLSGIIAGIFMDSIYSSVTGFYLLPYMYIGFGCGYFKKFLNYDNYVVPSILCGVSDLLMNIYIFIFGFAIRNRLNFNFYMINIIIPEVVYTIIISLILFRIQILFNDLINKWIRKRGEEIVKESVD